MNTDCVRCRDRNITVTGYSRYCMQIYAGRYCDDCWENHSLNHDRDFDPLDAGESLEEEDYDVQMY